MLAARHRHCTDARQGGRLKPPGVALLARTRSECCSHGARAQMIRDGRLLLQAPERNETRLLGSARVIGVRRHCDAECGCPVFMHGYRVNNSIRLEKKVGVPILSPDSFAGTESLGLEAVHEAHEAGVVCALHNHIVGCDRVEAAAHNDPAGISGGERGQYARRQ